MLEDRRKRLKQDIVKQGHSERAQMLKSANVQLAPLTSGDMPVMFKWINEREQVLHNAAYKPVSELMHQAWFEHIQKREDLRIFAIHLIKNDQIIGSCQLLDIDLVHRTAQLQIRIGEVDCRGHGYGTEAVRLLLDHAFKDLNLQRVWLHVFSTNARAIKVYEKAGFVREGLLRKAAHIDGTYEDVVVMGILRQEHTQGQTDTDS